MSYTSPHGGYVVPADPERFTAAHGAHGGGRGSLGYPVRDAAEEYHRAGWSDVATPGTYQVFERGVVYGSGHATHVVKGGLSPFDGVHRAWGGGGGQLGYPTAGEVRQAAGYWYQAFESGTIYVSPAGAYAVPLALDGGHRARGGGGGQLGYPTASPRTVGRVWTQFFERGTLECTMPEVGPPINVGATCRTV